MVIDQENPIPIVKELSEDIQGVVDEPIRNTQTMKVLNKSDEKNSKTTNNTTDCGVKTLRAGPSL